MAQEVGKPTTPSSLGIRSRSPRSLQTRNTKNLSLDIKDKKVEGAEPVNLDNIPSVITKPVAIGQRTARQSMVSRPAQCQISEAFIYSVPSGKRSVPSSPVYSLPGNAGKIGRGHSMSLSLKTSELLPSMVARGRAQTTSSALETSTPEVGHFDLQMDKKAWILPDGDEKGECDNDETSGEMLHPDVFKQNAYPDGPLLVVPPNVYLYSEPTLEETLQFDVVVNVAKEVANLGPLISQTKPVSYYHAKWSHSSKISVDLDRLTDIIHDAVGHNKKVLVHCQCGVSRSASLIVAYIMRFHNLGLNDAYSQLKRIAKDTSPNMGLIFQLMEWNEQRSRTAEGCDESQDDLSNRDSSIGVAIPSSASISDLTIGSTELTPRTPGDYFNKLSASSSSTSTSSSTVVGSHTNSKPVLLTTDLGEYLSTSSAGQTSTSDNFWTPSL